MNESKDGAAIALAKKAVMVGEASAELGDLVDEGVGCLVVVMDMHFDIAHAEAHHLSDAINNVAPVFFLGVKKAVLRTLPGCVQGSIAGNARPLVSPLRHPGKSCFYGSAHAQGLIV